MLRTPFTIRRMNTRLIILRAAKVTKGSKVAKGTKDAKARRIRRMSNDQEQGSGGTLVPPAEVPEAVEQQPKMDQSQLKAIVEALIFASPEPLTPKMLFRLLSDEPKEDVTAAIQGL